MNEHSFNEFMYSFINFLYQSYLLWKTRKSEAVHSGGSFLAISVLSHILLLLIYLRQLCTVKGSPYEIPNDISAEETAQNGNGTT